MRLLLDENLPKRLKQDYLDHDVSTVRDQGWNGLKNGNLLKVLTAAGFDALLTFDKNLQYQQNFKGYTVAVIVLQASINTYPVLSRLSSLVKDSYLITLCLQESLLFRRNRYANSSSEILHILLV